jgi:hypothetical protein
LWRSGLPGTAMPPMTASNFQTIDMAIGPNVRGVNPWMVAEAQLAQRQLRQSDSPPRGDYAVAREIVGDRISVSKSATPFIG